MSCLAIQEGRSLSFPVYGVDAEKPKGMEVCQHGWCKDWLDRSLKDTRGVRKPKTDNEKEDEPHFSRPPVTQPNLVTHA